MGYAFDATYYYSKKHLNYNVPTRAEYELYKLLNNKERGMFDVLETMPHNDTVIRNVVKCWSKINSSIYPKGTIYCSISGGSDSDVVMDITRRCDPERKIVYYFIDTGLESQYTKAHLDYLQLKYQVKIHRCKAKTPIPLAIKKHGIPFVSKQASEFLMRLQKFNFEFDDSDDLEALCEKYCKRLPMEIESTLMPIMKKHGRYKKIGQHFYYGCVSALEWWCNAKSQSGSSKFNIHQNTWLKEFLIKEGKIPFKVANKCCQAAKKDTIKEFMDNVNCKLSIQGVRKSEGGARATAYKSCFNNASSHVYDEYRPVFWFLEADKKEYVAHCDIHHSKLYDYMKRTGCLGCPFGRDIDAELMYAEVCEPQMKKAMEFLFGPSYEFTRKYHAFQKEMKQIQSAQKTEQEDSNHETNQL